MLLRRFFLCLLSVCALSATLWAAVVGTVRGVVHDPDHRPVPGASITIQAADSGYSQTVATNSAGEFVSHPLPVGAYRVIVTAAGFSQADQNAVVSSGAAPILHVQLSLASSRQSVDVNENAVAVNPDIMTPTTMINRTDIQNTPGAALSNSLNMITNYVPGSWVTHDQLHVRGGHQVTWAIDGVPIPNTNISSNVGPQIDPKDIDYLETQRGGYSADYGDRTYGVFNVVPRTGFERNREGELYTTFGQFHQTNDQVNFGSHTNNLAYFASANGNRSDYGLETPGPEIGHDRVWGLGGLFSLIYNRDAANQFRFFTTVRRDDYQIPSTSDNEHERDALAELTFTHVFRPGVLLSVSPFYHRNSATYEGAGGDVPISASQNRTSGYAGAQVSLNIVTSGHNARAGVYGFGQRDDEFISIMDAGRFVRQTDRSSGHLESAFFEDQYKVLSWMTLTAGVRLTHFTGGVSENAASPRLGAALRIPGLNWVLHGFWGRYYQAPPLSTVAGPLLQFAVDQGLGFIPLNGERDQEYQFGLAVPVRGWSIDLNRYNQRARNYFDHNAIGNSNVFFPLTIDRAHLYGWELSVHSPRIKRRGEVYVTYAYAHALASGAITGGLTDFAPPEGGTFLLDHDQQHTLHAGFHADLPHRLMASTDVYYGSGFANGASHLPGHVTFDATVGRSFGESFSVSVTALNAANRRFLLDNSPTFGGTHYADPRQIYAQIRYRFKY